MRRGWSELETFLIIALDTRSLAVAATSTEHLGQTCHRIWIGKGRRVDDK